MTTTSIDHRLPRGYHPMKTLSALTVSAALLLSACAPAQATDTITVATTQSRCGLKHHIQKRTVTMTYNSDGTIASAAVYGPWVRTKKAC